MWLAAKHPSPVKSLDSTTEMVIQGIFPWCFTPELYAARPEYIDSLAAFVRSRPMPPVDALLRQPDAPLAHDAASALWRYSTARDRSVLIRNSFVRFSRSG
jgi:hypothetical protein